MAMKSSSLFFLLLNIAGVWGGELVPIRPPGSGGSRKRQDVSHLDLRSQGNFIWGDAETHNAVANLTVYMDGENENILAMEEFDGMLTSVECATDYISMTFEDDATFAHAQRVWDWVNGADNNSFVMVAGAGDCGNNTRRIPYIISTLDYDEVSNTARLTSRETDWKSIAHTYDLVVGSVAQTPATETRRRRDIDKSTSVDFNHDFPFSFAIGSNGIEGRILCTNCSSTGSFDMEFKISQKLFIPTGASMKIKPKGVSAIAQIKLSGSGDLTGSLSKDFDIIEIPISALTIPGVLDLGPFLTLAVGYEIGPISLSAGIQSGASMKLSDDAILEADLLNPEENKFSGWEPEVDALPVRVDAAITGAAAVFLKPKLELQAEALGKGFAIGVNMRVPEVNAKLQALASPQGACPAAALPEGEKNAVAGVRISANIGGSLTFEAKKIGKVDDDPLFTVNIAAIEKPLAQVCWPFGDVVENPV